LPDSLRQLVKTTANGRVVLESRRPLQDVKTLADWAIERGYDLPDLDLRRPSLEDVYLEVTEPS